MQCLFVFISLFFPAVYAVVMLEVEGTAKVLTPTNVTWTREDGDPTLFDLRFVHRFDDLGFAATIDATDGELSGMVPVTFERQGRFVLKAVDFENGDRDIATSRVILVDAATPTIPGSSAISTSSSQSATPITVITTITSLPSGSSTSAIAGATHIPSRASGSATNAAAIVGGVLGSVAFILILAIFFILMRRRKDAKKNRRMTFKRDLMVQQRPPIAPDIEQGSGIGTSPILPPLSFEPPVTVCTPQGPTRSQFPVSALRSPGLIHPPTHRQMRLGTRIVQLENQMASIRRQNRGMAGMETVLEHMRKQVDWLRTERDSPWARCETDVPPPMLDYYME